MSALEPSQPTASQSGHRAPATGVVTMLDVLGWKGIYNRERDPITSLETLIRDMEKASEKYRGLVFELEIRSISDTVVMFSKVTETDATQAIDAHGGVCAEAITRSIVARIPLRGATCYGDFEVRDNIYVGRAIDEAAAWHDVGEWVGVHLTPSANFLVESPLNHWVVYSPPLKHPQRCKTRCLDWWKNWRASCVNDNPLKRLKAVFRTMGPIVPEIAPKFENTIAFAEKRQERVKEGSEVREEAAR